MNNKKKVVKVVSPKGDTTQKERQRNRRAKLDEIARGMGYKSWSAYETAMINNLSKGQGS